MSIPKDYCKCGNSIMVSTANIYCGRCNLPLLRAEDVQHLAELDVEEAQGHPDGLSDGNIKIAIANSSSMSSSVNDWKPTRRELIAFLAGSFVTVLATSFQGHLGILTGSTKMDEEERSQARSQLLTIDDVQAVDKALHRGSDLQALTNSYIANGRYSVALLLEALSGHVFGVSPGIAKNNFDTLIEMQHSDEVRAYLLFRRAKVRVLLGEVHHGLADLNESIKLTAKENEELLVTKLRQAANHAYISISEEDVQSPSKWIEMHQYLAQAMNILNIPLSDDYPNQIAMIRQLSRPEPAIGVLYTYNMLRTAELFDSPQECRKTMANIIDILAIWQEYDHITAWNCHTPLAAQAIRLDHPDIAEKVLTMAASYADSTNTPIARYATSQRDSRGVEWLFHKLQWVALHIDKAQKSRSKADQIRELTLADDCLIEVLTAKNSVRTLLLLRAAKLYQWQIQSMQGKVADLERITVEAFNSPAYSHWTYFPKLPEITRQII